MKEEAQVVMLPTETSYIAIVKETGLPQLFDKLIVHSKNLRPVHLYITTDEDIMSGEWVLFADVVMIAKSFDDRVVYDGEGNSFMKGNCKKIIATTDPKLRSDSLIEDPARPEDNLLIRKGMPKIPQSFIESYCKNPVDKVMVEYGLFHDGNFKDDGETHPFKSISRPKLTSNNEIIIHPIEEKLYTREEVEALIRSYQDELGIMGGASTFVSDWIKKNL